MADMQVEATGTGTASTAPAAATPSNLVQKTNGE